MVTVTASFVSFATIALIMCTMAQFTKAQNPEGLVRHIVSFRFKDNVTLTQQSYIISNYTSLKHKCVDPISNQPYIVSFDAGIPNSREGFQQLMQQVYIVTFKSTADRDYFVGKPWTIPFDPVHDAFKNYVGPFLREPIETGLIVIDFTVLK